MNAKEMWQAYCQGKDLGRVDFWQYGAAPDKLAELTLSGIKTATASAFEPYELDETEELPQVNSHSVILNSKDEAVCVIQTTNIEIVPFKEVPAKQAFKEGEGDRSLAYWRDVHEEFFTNELSKYGLTFTEDMLVVCEEFEVVYPK